MNTLRVMHVIETMGLGGAEVLLASTLPRMAAHADVRVRSLTGPDTLQRDFERGGVDARMLRDGINAEGSLLRFARQLRQELRARPADIVHTHLFKATLAGRLLRVSWPSGPRLVTTLHSPDYSHPETSSRWRGRARRAVDWGSSLAANDAIVTVSHAVAADFRAHMGSRGPWGRLEVIHNVIDVAGYAGEADRVDRAAARRARGWSPEQVVVLSIGRLIYSKNFEAIIDAIAGLRQRGIDAIGVVLGEGPERAALERKSQGLVRFPGTASRADVVEALVACDVYAQPSRWEAFGMANLEAMAAGRAVVACAVDGIREVVAHGETGLLVPAGETGRLIDALAQLAHDDGLRRRLGDAGRERAARLFDIDGWITRTLDLYSRLCPHASLRP